MPWLTGLLWGEKCNCCVSPSAAAEPSPESSPESCTAASPAPPAAAPPSTCSSRAPAGAAAEGGSAGAALPNLVGVVMSMYSGISLPLLAPEFTLCLYMYCSPSMRCSTCTRRGAGQGGGGGSARQAPHHRDDAACLHRLRPAAASLPAPALWQQHTSGPIICISCLIAALHTALRAALYRRLYCGLYLQVAVVHLRPQRRQPRQPRARQMVLEALIAREEACRAWLWCRCHAAAWMAP